MAALSSTLSLDDAASDLLSSAAECTAATPVEATRHPLAMRAAARREGRAPDVLSRIIDGGGAPAVSAFGSAL